MPNFSRLAPQTWLFWLLTGLTLVLHAPLLRHFGSAVPNDIGDPILNTWILWWNAHAVPLTTAYWNAPIFAPAPNAFALSETLLGLTWLTTPLQWLGASPVVAHNAMFVATPVLNGMAAYWLCVSLTMRRDAAIIGALAFAFAPYYANQISHIQTRATFFMPIALVGLHRFWISGDRRWLALMTGAVALNGLVCGYFLLYFGVLLGLAIAWLTIATRDWKKLAHGIAGLIVAAALIAPVAWKFREVRNDWNLRRSITEIESFSADATSHAVGSKHLVFGPSDKEDPTPEIAQYPGAVLVALLLVALLMPSLKSAPDPSPERWRTRTVIGLLGVAAIFLAFGLVAWLGEARVIRLGPIAISLDRAYKPIGIAFDLVMLAILVSPRFTARIREGSISALYAFGAASCALLALGPVGKVFGHRFWYMAPFSWLMAVPGFDAVRVPALFGCIEVVCLSVLAAFAVVRLFPEITRQSRVVCAVLATAIVLEGWAIFGVVPVPQKPPAPMTADLVVELPMRGWAEDAAAMYRSMSHRRPIVNGYSGYNAPHYEQLRKDLNNRCFDSLNVLRGGRSLDVVVWLNDVEGPEIDQALSAKWGSVVKRETAGNAAIYRLPAGPAANSPGVFESACPSSVP